MTKKETSLPDQPNGICARSDDDMRLPSPRAAAERVVAYVRETGDGLYDEQGGKPLYARDLTALGCAVLHGYRADAPGRCLHDPVADVISAADAEIVRLQGELARSEAAGADLIAQRRAHDVARTAAEVALANVEDDPRWRSTLSYAATALDGSADNGDRYCARQIRDYLQAHPSGGQDRCAGCSHMVSEHRGACAHVYDDTLGYAECTCPAFVPKPPTTTVDRQLARALVDAVDTARRTVAYVAGQQPSQCAARLRKAEEDAVLSALGADLAPPRDGEARVAQIEDVLAKHGCLAHVPTPAIRELAAVPAVAVDEMTRLLAGAWASAEPDHPVTKFPASYVSTWVAVARALLAVDAEPTVTADQRAALARVFLGVRSGPENVAFYERSDDPLWREALAHADLGLGTLGLAVAAEGGL